MRETRCLKSFGRPSPPPSVSRSDRAIRTAALDVGVGTIAPSFTSAAIEGDTNARNAEPRLADRLEEVR
jgi:hypothetical protein